MTENLEELQSAIAAQTEIVKLLKREVDHTFDQAIEPAATWPRVRKYVHVSLIKSAVRFLQRQHGQFTAKEAARVPELLVGFAIRYDRDLAEIEGERSFRESFAGLVADGDEA